MRSGLSLGGRGEWKKTGLYIDASPADIVTAPSRPASLLEKEPWLART